ncbi:carbon storage regulator [Marinomonas rhizomae]|nr:carbon storage regulator [Marinomonas rhizomae]
MVCTHKRKLRFHGRLRFAYRALQVMLFMFSSEGQVRVGVTAFQDVNVHRENVYRKTKRLK